MQTCLILDESSVIRKVAGRILFQLGFTVSNAASSQEAIELIAASGMPDVLIVAGCIGDGSCVDFIREVRGLENGSTPVILALLVEANLGQMTRLKRAGATGFIYKPFDRQALSDWLQPYVKNAA
ncbi:response regulator [Mangrovicella endophytica]|uniref:response regulator n=1 Tax=Mangrovicella endophytica TaxID=2066697 RepID=UPI0012FFF017|nr:response regulator [Mangrovicella endophytica]